MAPKLKGSEDPRFCPRVPAGTRPSRAGQRPVVTSIVLPSSSVT